MPDKIPKGWVRTTLGEACSKPQYGWTTSGVPQGTLHLLRTTDITSGRIDWDTVPFCRDEPPEPGRYLLRNGDIVVSRAGSVGFGVRVTTPPNAVFASYLIRFRPAEGINGEYVAYFLQSPSYWMQVRARAVGIAIPNLNASKLQTFHFPLAPEREQERIVSKLDGSLSRIAAGETAARRAQERLKRYRIAVLEAAVTGELTREWRKTHKPMETSVQLLKRILSERRAQWELAELRRLRAAGKPPKDEKWKRRYDEPKLANVTEMPELPREWRWASLDQLLSQMRNGIGTPPNEQSGLPVLRISAVRPMSVDIKDRRYLPKSLAKKFADYALEEGDLLFTRYNGSRDLAGVCGRVPALSETLLYPDKLIRCVVVPGFRSLNGYLEIATNCGASRKKISDSLRTTAGQWGISGGALKETPVPLPPLEEQIEIIREVERRVSAADRLRATLNRQFARARATRQSLLREAFAGKLVRQDAEDESATVLLERIRAAREPEVEKPKAKRMSKTKSKTVRRPLLDVLRAHKKGISPEQLFRESGFQAEFEANEYRQEAVDKFYEELRSITGPRGTVLEKRPSKTRVLLSVKL